MYLIGIKITIHFYHVNSLKDKRRIVKSVLDRIRSKFKISTAEVDFLDRLDRGGLGFGIVSNNRQHAEKLLQKVINQIDLLSEVEIIDIEWYEA